VEVVVEEEVGTAEVEEEEPLIMQPPLAASLPLRT